MFGNYKSQIIGGQKEKFVRYAFKISVTFTYFISVQSNNVDEGF